MVETMNVDDVKEHKIASMHPLYTDEQFAGLSIDIRENGQQQPVVMYRGRLVDGRHRLRALKELGCNTIDYTTLANNMTLDEVKQAVKSTDVRRHVSPTQLAIKANAMWEAADGDMKQAEAIIRCQSNKTNFKRVRSILSMGRRDLIDRLFAGGKVNVSLDPTFITLTDSLYAIVEYVKATGKEEIYVDNSILEDEVPDIDYSRIANFARTMDKPSVEHFVANVSLDTLNMLEDAVKKREGK